MARGTLLNPFHQTFAFKALDLSKTTKSPSIETKPVLKLQCNACGHVCAYSLAYIRRWTQSHQAILIKYILGSLLDRRPSSLPLLSQ